MGTDQVNKMRWWSDRVKGGISVATLTGVLGPIWFWQFVTDKTIHVDSSQLSLAPKLLLYGIFALTLWSAFQVFDIFFRHVYRSPMAWWWKAVWFCTLTIWPLGPLLYYAVVFRRSDLLKVYERVEGS